MARQIDGMEAIVIVNEIIEFVLHARKGELLKRAARTLGQYELGCACHHVIRLLEDLSDKPSCEASEVQRRRMTELLQICPEMLHLFNLENDQLVLAKSLSKDEISTISKFVRQHYKPVLIIEHFPTNRFIRLRKWIRQLFS